MPQLAFTRYFKTANKTPSLRAEKQKKHHKSLIWNTVTSWSFQAAKSTSYAFDQNRINWEEARCYCSAGFTWSWTYSHIHSIISNRRSCFTVSRSSSWYKEQLITLDLHFLLLYNFLVIKLNIKEICSLINQFASIDLSQQRQYYVPYEVSHYAQNIKWEFDW